MPGTDDPHAASTIPGAGDKEYYYSVLNLPKTASDQEIRERYRQLSIVFHPDKQTDERRKEAATERFLELQKAYEVLSDPVTRRAYDILGQEGLLLLQSADFRHVAEEEFEEELRRQQRELDRLRVEQAIHPKGNITVGLDASPFFDYEYETEDGSPLSPWQHLQASLGDVRRDTFAVRHRVQAQIRDKTWFVMTGRVTTGSKPPPERGAYMRSVLMGTVKHQLSPRLDFEATTNLLAVSGVSMKGTYHTADYTVSCQTGIHPLLFLQLFTYKKGDVLLIPGVNVSLARRLFPKSPMQGVLEVGMTAMGPKISAALASSTFHDSLPGEDMDNEPSGTSAFRAPSVSGVAYYSSEWQFGFDLAGSASGLNGRYALIFHELGMNIQAVVRFGLAELMWLFGGEWRGTNAAVGANVSAGTGGVTLRVDATYFGQTLTLPVVLSREHNDSLAFWTAVLPSAAFAVAYYFKIRPGRRKQRILFLNEARRQLREEKSELLRQWKETVSLLEDTAQRHMRTEEACDGLVVLEARYGPSEEEEGTEGLEVDVTVPVQALVNSSQLYIPGKRSKAGIPGFYDPVVGVPKTLRIRYKFRGRMHYAEIPDHMPVVLPLKDHLVE
ncbi:DnaJ-domain-containing protein [Trametes coccinea BRFM310]|uniref:DnaJ-domain-containing protein n=1 Tax=Trametes coccinea (strain BRFM310) TaxID=1353009 RepID=A0A1Y2J5R5_TRAC3|nr:DnaJ-domain-containing protein [Trametes coccinea BRFM310]